MEERRRFKSREEQRPAKMAFQAALLLCPESFHEFLSPKILRRSAESGLPRLHSNQ
jgi:hypothetical protein